MDSLQTGIMDIINTENKLCVIMRKMNILKFGSHTKKSEYLDNIFSHGFLPVITKPTRIATSSSTLIGYIYTNNLSKMANSGIIITDKANSINKVRLFSESNITKFKESLNQIDFHHVLEITCPNEAYNEFYRLHKRAFESSFPLHEFRNNHIIIKRDSWFTKGLLISSQRKRKLLSRKLLNRI